MTNTNLLRTLMWGAAASLLLLPWIAMRFTSEVNWTGSDFAVFGAMLFCACIAGEFALRASENLAYRAAAALAIGGAFGLVWVDLAVGIVGVGFEPANLMFAAVLAVGIGLGLRARFKPAGMVGAMQAAALVQGLAGAVVVFGGLEDPAVIVGFTMFFVALWLASARLFQDAARDLAPHPSN